MSLKQLTAFFLLAIAFAEDFCKYKLCEGEKCSDNINTYVSPCIPKCPNWYALTYQSNWYARTYRSRRERPTSICMRCPNGKYSDGFQCKQCLSGTYLRIDGKCKLPENSDVPCSAGKYGPRTAIAPNEATCSSCSIGQFQEEFGQESCKPCLPGTFNNETGSDSCFIVKEGKYVGTHGCTTENCAKEESSLCLDKQVHVQFNSTHAGCIVPSNSSSNSPSFWYLIITLGVCLITLQYI